ncbi:MAG: FKBP-type peptidyl-prolyl cis-trans isomerase [Prevotella sp.]|nr:FKBP-type peptidyl-prolyl cis-trans isomerase [Prevotella sp.]
MCLLFLSFTLACSEEDATEDEYANWQERNEAFFASLQDSLQRNPAQWQRFKNYSFDETVETMGPSSDYIYVKVISSGAETTSPAFTDSVRVIYQGRLIPTASYPEGKIFEGTVYGQFSPATSATAKQLVSRMIEGYATALQHMHRGDYWRVYIPSELGYGSTGSGSSIPAYSTIIFDLMLIDFAPTGETLPVWSSRQR